MRPRFRPSILVMLPLACIAIQAAAFGAASPPHPLGTVAGDMVQAGCPAGFACQGVTVSCPDLSGPFHADIAMGRAPAGGRGMVVFFSGGPGTAWWGSSERGELIATPFLERLRQQDRFDVVLVRWWIGWNKNARGKDPGPALNSCRAATIIRWVHDDLYIPPADGRGTGECGFCVTGNSGGSIETAYALSHYRLGAIIDAAILSSGPPHAALDRGCLRNPGDEALWYDDEWSRLVDTSYGAGQSGPCTMHDEAWADRWKHDSVRGPGTYRYLRTRVGVIIGTADKTPAAAHARVYFDRLQGAASPMITFDTIQGMPHSIHQSPAGLDALEARLTGSAPPPPAPTRSSSPSASTSPCRYNCGRNTGDWTAEAALAGGAVVGLAYPAYVLFRRRQPL